MPRLKPEVKAAWVKELKSGRYTQGFGWLRDNQDKYCCLGVRCELGVKAGVIQNDGLYIHAYLYGNPEGDSPDEANFQDTMPPAAERKWAWVDYEKFPDDVHAAEVRLAEMNDNGMDFREIANRIEAMF